MNKVEIIYLLFSCDINTIREIIILYIQNLIRISFYCIRIYIPIILIKIDLFILIIDEELAQLFWNTLMSMKNLKKLDLNLE